MPPKAKKATAPAAGDAATTESPPELADGAASTDPAVHFLLAQRHTHIANGDGDAAAQVSAQLAELGYR